MIIFVQFTSCLLCLRQVQPKSRQQQNYPAYSMSPYQQLSPPPHQRGSPSPPRQEYVLPHAHPTATTLSAVYRAAPQTIRSNSLPLGSTLSRREEEVFAVPKVTPGTSLLWSLSPVRNCICLTTRVFSGNDGPPSLKTVIQFQ